MDDVVTRAEFDELRQRVQALEQHRSPLSRTDGATLPRLLPAIVGAIGSTAFVVDELLPLPAVHMVLPEWTAGRLGKLLKRATGTVIDGLLVERMSTENHAVVWRVVGVPEFHRSRNSGTSPVRRRPRLRSRS
jgi:hypothetical protein